MTRQTKFDRRAVLIGSAAGLFYAKGALAQTISVPSLGSTLEIVNSSRASVLLYNQFGLAYSLATNIFLLRSQRSDLNLQEFRPYSKSLEIWTVLTQLSNGDNSRREQILSALQDRTDVALSGSTAEQHAQLVEQLVNQAREFGLLDGSKLMENTINSVTHVERIASVTTNVGAESTYFCRVFPFKYLCR